jgi:hypothetical protein
MQSLRELLRSDSPVQIIGLVDEGTGAFIIQISRASGARPPWLGQHAAIGPHVRHHIMQARQTGHTVDNLLRTKSWPEALGFTLAASATGQTTTQTFEISDMSCICPATPSLSGHFVSFLIESWRN